MMIKMYFKFLKAEDIDVSQVRGNIFSIFGLTINLCNIDIKASYGLSRS